MMNDCHVSYIPLKLPPKKVPILPSRKSGICCLKHPGAVWMVSPIPDMRCSVSCA